MYFRSLWLLSFCFAVIGFLSCSKTNSATTDAANNQDTIHLNPKFNYGDSVFYRDENVADHIIKPVQTGVGEYWGFPDCIDIDNKNGEINLSKTETGLRYRIYFVPKTGGDTLTTVILLSGINYLDKIYNISKSETVAAPVYNADLTKEIPGKNGSSVFDEGGGCNSQGVAVNKSDGRIDLSQMIKNGVFGNTPSNGASKEVDLNYRIQDKSNKSLNTLRVKFYYFNTAADITPDLVQLLKDREGMTFNIQPRQTNTANQMFLSSVALTASRLGRPRPPCLFIVSH